MPKKPSRPPEQAITLEDMQGKFAELAAKFAAQEKRLQQLEELAATDALTGIDLTTVVNDQGQADPAKLKTALDDLVTRKPHLAKPAERIAPPGIGGGAPAGATDAEKVKAVLADMQKATGVRLPAPSNTNH